MIKKTIFIIFLFSSMVHAVDPVPYRKVASQGLDIYYRDICSSISGKRIY